MLNTMSYQSVFCHLHIEHTIPLITPDFLPTEDTRHSPAKKQHQKNNRLMTSPRNTEKKKEEASWYRLPAETLFTTAPCCDTNLSHTLSQSVNAFTRGGQQANTYGHSQR